MNTQRILTNAIEIQQIPAPTFQETQRSIYLEKKFQAAGLSNVTTDDLGNVFGRTPGAVQPSIILSAHMDTVFPERTNLELRQEGDLLIGPGIGDNAISLALLIEAAEEFSKRTPNDGQIWFVANVREEGLGNLEGMQRVVQRFAQDAKAYIVLEGMGLGHIYHRGLQVQRYRISVETKGGHAWIHAGRASAIHILVNIGSDIIRIDQPQDVQTSLNIGTIAGGTSINTIANFAYFDLDLRSESPGVLEAIDQDLQNILDEHEVENVQINKELIGQRPGGGIPPDHELVQLACRALEAGEVSECKLGIASTDANVPLSNGYPAICIGLTQGGHAHTVDEYIDTRTIPNGYKTLEQLILYTLESQRL